MQQDLISTDNQDDSQLNLADYAQRAYLEYALSVVKGRALPDVCDGQKPVQRRILYSMSRMGLGFGGPNGNTGAKPVKCARVVGDVLGRFHPHGDQAAYDALVRMAQDFSQRYPLIDGQGNFGSRDGDGAAAMRYTEARLARITSLLLDEIDEGTVDFQPNYDGSTDEPRLLPGRLPFVLLNGASGIAVGLATEIPSHNLREVSAAAIALIRNEHLSDDELYAQVPGPDYPGGGQIISSPADIRDAYATGRGSLVVDTAKCTMCLSCVGACPEAALADNPDAPHDPLVLVRTALRPPLLLRRADHGLGPHPVEVVGRVKHAAVGADGRLRDLRGEHRREAREGGRGAEAPGRCRRVRLGGGVGVHARGGMYPARAARERADQRARASRSVSSTCRRWRSSRMSMKSLTITPPSPPCRLDIRLTASRAHNMGPSTLTAIIRLIRSADI